MSAYDQSGHEWESRPTATRATLMGTGAGAWVPGLCRAQPSLDHQWPKLFTRDGRGRPALVRFRRHVEPNQCFKSIIAFVTHPDVTHVIAAETFRVFRCHQ